MALKCEICDVKCVGCRRICRCGMNTSQVSIINNIVLKYSLKGDTNTLNNIVKLAKKGKKEEEIVELMYSKEEDKIDIVIDKSSNSYCEFPSGSANQGKWVECIKCGTPRFRSEGKICNPLDNKKD